jgi:signal transduction histidine kinase/FixJ family two-component response regulator/molybdopterin converting factor small subunit
MATDTDKINKTLLIVDDEEGICKVLSITLSDSGYKVFTAKNGQEALKIFEKIKPPIVLTDIKMPVMDGIDLLRQIKRVNPDTEVIMITGHGDMELAIKSLKYEAVDFVTKPINNDALDIALNRAHEKIDMRQKLRDYTENLEAMVREKSASLVEAERQAAVNQTVEGFSHAMKNIALDFKNGTPYLNEMPCYISIHNQQLKIVAINQLYREVIGDKVGFNSNDIYKNKTSPDFECPASATLKTGIGQRTTAEIESLHSQELPVIVHTAPIRNQNGDIELVIEIAVNISEVNRLKEKLYSTQQKYQQLFDEVPCYISVQDKDLKLVSANKKFKSDFDYQSGVRCFEIYKKRTEPCPNCPVIKTFNDGKTHQSEMVVNSKSGKQYNVLIWTAPIRNSEGHIEQVIEMSTNITQIRQLQDHLSSIGLKISSISHGIKGLLAGLDGSMYLVESGFKKEDQKRIKEGWNDVRTVVRRIRKLVLEILFFAKERKLRCEKIEINRFVQDVVATIQPNIKAKGIDIICNIESSIGHFEIDPDTIRSALINILENALDACLEDKSKQSHKIIFAVTSEKDNIIFEIKDNGIGMDKETIESLFTLFFSSKGSKGTGLGLFIANNFVQQHNGEIKVDSTIGKGSIFTIIIPRTFLH